MIKTKNNIVGSIKPKLNIAGKINKTIEYISPNNQEKNVIPTKEKQEITPDEKYNGLSKVIVDKIPDEYIIPSGEINISQNGTYDVTDKTSAKVNVPEKQLGTKTIIKNGTYNATDDNLDGYSKVEVATSGVDLNDYIKSTIEEGTSSYSAGQWIKSVKQLPVFTFNGKNTSYHFSGFKGSSIDLSSFNTTNVTNMTSLFNSCSSLTSLDVNNFNTSKVTNMGRMFSSCSSLTSLDVSNLTATSLTNANMMFYNCLYITSIDLSNFENTKTVSVSQMFQYCSRLSNLNMSKFDFTKISNYSSMFNYVPKNCYILVKDEAQKTAFNTKFPTMTNVHYVGEEG